MTLAQRLITHRIMLSLSMIDLHIAVEDMCDAFEADRMKQDGRSRLMARDLIEKISSGSFREVSPAGNSNPDVRGFFAF